MTIGDVATGCTALVTVVVAVTSENSHKWSVIASSSSQLTDPDEVQFTISMLVIRDVSSIQYFETLGWLTGRASGSNIPKDSFLSDLHQPGVTLEKAC